jgi:hypothetical protein
MDHLLARNVNNMKMNTKPDAKMNLRTEVDHCALTCSSVNRKFNVRICFGLQN